MQTCLPTACSCVCWEAEGDRAVTCHTKALRHPQQGHGARALHSSQMPYCVLLGRALPALKLWRPSSRPGTASFISLTKALRWLPILLKVNTRPGSPSNLPAPFLSACFCCSCLVLLSRHTCFSSFQTAYSCFRAFAPAVPALLADLK